MRLIDRKEMKKMIDSKTLEQINNIIHTTLSYDLIYDQDETTLIVESLRKQIPKKIAKTSYFYGYIYGCPCCDNHISKERNSTIQYCNHCGQALDWRE